MNRDLEVNLKVRCDSCSGRFDTLASNLMAVPLLSAANTLGVSSTPSTRLAVCPACIDSFNRKGFLDSSFPRPEGEKYMGEWILDYLRGCDG